MPSKRAIVSEGRKVGFGQTAGTGGLAGVQARACKPRAPQADRCNQRVSGRPSVAIGYKSASATRSTRTDGGHAFARRQNWTRFIERRRLKRLGGYGTGNTGLRKSPDTGRFGLEKGIPLNAAFDCDARHSGKRAERRRQSSCHGIVPLSTPPPAAANA